MLQMKNITVTHKRDFRVLIEDFSLYLNPGDKAAIIGEEGNGKSTLLKLVYDASLIEGYADYTGEIIKNGARLGYLAQELDESDKNRTVYEYCMECGEFCLMAPKELGEIARTLSLDTGFFYSDQMIKSLSGGEKVKLQLARILMERPDILCLDEPSNDIDIQTLEWLGDFIRRTPLPVLFISHDEMLLGQTANKIIHFEQLQRKTKPRHTVAATGYEAYIGNRQQAFARQEQMARRERSEYEKKQERFRRIQQKVEHQQNIITRQDPHGGQLLKKKMHAVKAMERRYEKEAEQMSEFPQTEEAVFIRFGDKTSLPAGKRVLDFYCGKLCAAGQVLAQDIRLTVCGPQHVCIVGKNGAGKTTLLKQIAKELSGRTDLNVFYMPQNYEELLGQEQTPVEFLSVEAGREEAGRIQTYLGSMKFSADEMAHPVSMLSGGQKAKLLLLKVSMQGCNVLLLDEPTRNFSPLSAPVIRAMLKDYGGAIISVSHDRRYIEEVCTEVYELTANGLERTRL